MLRLEHRHATLNACPQVLSRLHAPHLHNGLNRMYSSAHRRVDDSYRVVHRRPHSYRNPAHLNHDLHGSDSLLSLTIYAISICGWHGNEQLQPRRRTIMGFAREAT